MQWQFENSFAMQRLQKKKLLQCNIFNRLKKNEKSIFGVEIAQNPHKFEIGTLPNMTSSRPRDWVT